MRRLFTMPAISSPLQRCSSVMLLTLYSYWYKQLQDTIAFKPLLKQV